VHGADTLRVAVAAATVESVILIYCCAVGCAIWLLRLRLVKARCSVLRRSVVQHSLWRQTAAAAVVAADIVDADAAIVNKTLNAAVVCTSRLLLC